MTVTVLAYYGCNVFLLASSLFLGFLTFEPHLLGLLRERDCLSHLWDFYGVIYSFTLVTHTSVLIKKLKPSFEY